MLFHYKISPKSSVSIVHMGGELIEKSQGEPLVQEIKALLEKGSRKFVLDFSNLRYMNSSGLGILVTILTKVRNNGGELAVTNLNKKIKELLVITKLNQMFHVTNTLEEAIGELSKSNS